MIILNIALDVPLDRYFDYLPPVALATGIGPGDIGPGDIGRRILVPFGGRKLVGVIVGLRDDSAVPIEKLKPAIKVFRDEQQFDRHMLAVFEFCRGYYHHPIGEVIINALPPGLRRQRPVFGRGASGKRQEAIRLTDAGRSLEPASLPGRALVKRKLIAALHTRGSLRRLEIVGLSARAPRLLPELVAAGLITVEHCPMALGPGPGPGPGGQASRPPSLGSEQQAAIAAVAEGFNRFGVTLLHGVTGSGKTEVYLRLVERALGLGKQTLILVPEINLTPQLEATFRGRFPDVAQVSLHSQLAEGERVEHYLAAQTGRARIVLGTRLAVFTPLAELALIIVDEEHDNSFKQQEGLRYSARDVAIYRARELAIPVLLGSATPSLESYYNGQTARYRLLQLPARAVPEAKLPAVRLVAMEKKSRAGVAPPVIEALRQRLARSEQSLVFINRRGYAPVLLCPQCGWVSACTRCSARLTLHAPNNRLRCHHCGLEASAPPHCPGCGAADLRGIGQGSQRVEATLAEQFAGARILRIDRDTTSSKGQLATFIDRVHAEQVDILVGTQMLAKGHDFPKLTLVAVINADASLYSSDFRAEEKLFAQLMQVGGRAGRAGLPGEVLVQTAFPEHPLFAALQRHRFADFAHGQLQLRREARFPPFSFQALLRTESIDGDAARQWTRQAATLAEPLARRVRVFDAVPASMARIAGRSRWQVLAQSASRAHLQPFLRAWRRALERITVRDVRWAIDVDPAEL